MAKIVLIQGEARNLPFRIRDKITRKWLDLRGATCLFVAKRLPDDREIILTKADTDFDKSMAENGYLSLFLTSDDTWIDPWVYNAEIRLEFDGQLTLIYKIRFEMEIEQAVY